MVRIVSDGLFIIDTLNDKKSAWQSLASQMAKSMDSSSSILSSHSKTLMWIMSEDANAETDLLDKFQGALRGFWRERIFRTWGIIQEWIFSMMRWLGRIKI